MSLHPDLAAFLELAEFGRLTGKSKPMHELSVEAARAEFEATSAILDPAPPADLKVLELTFTTRDGIHLPARLYRRSTTAAGAQPLTLYFHGGGFVVGSLNSHDSVCRRLASTGAAAVLAPAYRLAPEHRAPTALDDALDSVNWLTTVATELNLDINRVSFAGDSVGATLATSLALIAAVEPARITVQPLCQLLFYPVTDMSRQRASHRLYAEGYLLEADTLEWFYSHYCAAHRDDPRLSPLLVKHLPVMAPAYISLARFDPLVDEGLAYVERLRASGTQVHLDIQEGLTHDFLRMTGIVAEAAQVYGHCTDWQASQVIREEVETG